MKTNKLKEIWKEHKKEILIVTGLTALGGVFYVVTKKTPESTNMNVLQNWMSKFTSVSLEEQARIKAFDCNVGTVVNMWNEGGFLNVIMDDLTVSDIGNLGQEFLKLDGMADNTKLSLIIGLDN